MNWADFYLICFPVDSRSACCRFLRGCAGSCICRISRMCMTLTCLRYRGSPAVMRGSPVSDGRVVTHSHTASISPFNFITLTAFLRGLEGLAICSPATPVLVSVRIARRIPGCGGGFVLFLAGY